MSDLFRDERLDGREYEYASEGSRFSNSIVDQIVNAILVFGVALVSILLLDLSGGMGLLSEENDAVLTLFSYVLAYLVSIMYYAGSEYLFKGKTLGKLVTKTRAVTEDNERMSFGTCFKRSFCRLIPFEAFSFLSDNPQGWHDRFSNTKVILDEDWIEVEEL
ncbi:RDD family protein [Chitinophagales bacterium]|nr:RDD family protein [Chitinophagales bacterium]